MCFAHRKSKHKSTLIHGIVNMTDYEKAFRRAMCLHPDSDLHIGVYSDWLQEKGGPRGEFIRLQQILLELSGTASGGEDQTDHLFQRTSSVLAEVTTRWLGGVLGWFVGQCPSGATLSCEGVVGGTRYPFSSEKAVVSCGDVTELSVDLVSWCGPRPDNGPYWVSRFPIRRLRVRDLLSSREYGGGDVRPTLFLSRLPEAVRAVRVVLVRTQPGLAGYPFWEVPRTDVDAVTDHVNALLLDWARREAFPEAFPVVGEFPKTGGP